MFSGLPNDINNTISMYDVYAVQSDYPVDIGRPDSTATQTAPTNDTPSTGATNNTMNAAANSPGKPGHWWITFAVIFVAFIFAARKFGGDDRYSNIRMSVYNGIFLTFFIVLILNALKRIAAVAPPNAVSTLILAA